MAMAVKMTALAEAAEAAVPYSFILWGLLPFRLLESLLLREEMEVTMVEMLATTVKEEEVLVEDLFSNLHQLLVQAVQEHLMLEEVQLDPVAFQGMAVPEE